ncbi:MAG: hypothetical protein ABSB52_14825, partial [Acidimicrobiales bacterium]
NAPSGEAIIGDTLYVLDADEMRAVNLSTGQVTSVTTGGYGWWPVNSSNPADVTMGAPRSLTTDGRYLYFIDFIGDGYWNIRRTDPLTGATTTAFWAGSFGDYMYVTEGADGNLYATTDYGDVVQIDPTTGATMAVASDLGYYDLGQITDGDSILEIPYSTMTSSTLVTSSVLSNYDGGFTAAGSYLYAATDSGTDVRRYDATTGATTLVAGSPGTYGYDDGSYYSGWFNGAQALVSDGQDTLYVADTGNNRIRAITEASPQPDTNPGLSSGLTTTLLLDQGTVSTFAGSGTASDKRPQRRGHHRRHLVRP